MEAALSAEHELDDVSVEEDGTQLVLQQAQTHQTAHVAVRVQALGGGAALNLVVSSTIHRI